MKSVIFFCLLLSGALQSQNKSGSVNYTETIKITIDAGENEELKKMMPPAQVVKKVLLFNENESIFKNGEENNDIEVKHEEEGAQFNIVMKVPNSVIYMNVSKDELVQSQDLFGKEFLIQDKIEKRKWKFTGEQKKVLDFTCQKAILIDTAQNVEIWFTPQVPVGIGPNGLSGVPGLILAVDYDNGDRTVIANAVQFKDHASFKSDIPTKGKKLNRTEYNKIREEKMKEMGAIHGGSGKGVKMIIRQERN